MNDRVALVLVNGPPNSVQAPRARALFEESSEDGPTIVYKEHGRFGSIQKFRQALNEARDGWIYCIDLGFPSSLLAALRRSKGKGIRLAYELGDPIKPLLANQNRGAAQVALAHWMDRHLPSRADKLVFRGSYLIDYFRSIAPKGSLPPSLWLPDGVDVDLFRPRHDQPEALELRRRHGLEGRFVVGIVGNIHYNSVHNLFYGWELAESLALIPGDLPITGVVVGDGPGRPVLEAVKERLNLGDRLKLVGRVPHAEVPLWMSVFDVGLSTQTDDPVGWGRTTAKLPEYLACGTPLLCTDVGEAHRWLAESGQTLPYSGMRDEGYPARLAEQISRLHTQDLTPLREHNRELALKLFDYRVLRPQLREFLGS